MAWTGEGEEFFGPRPEPFEHSEDQPTAKPRSLSSFYRALRASLKAVADTMASIKYPSSNYTFKVLTALQAGKLTAILPPTALASIVLQKRNARLSSLAIFPQDFPILTIGLLPFTVDAHGVTHTILTSDVSFTGESIQLGSCLTAPSWHYTGQNTHDKTKWYAEVSRMVRRGDVVYVTCFEKPRNPSENSRVVQMYTLMEYIVQREWQSADLIIQRAFGRRRAADWISGAKHVFRGYEETSVKCLLSAAFVDADSEKALSSVDVIELIYDYFNIDLTTLSFAHPEFVAHYKGELEAVKGALTSFNYGQFAYLTQRDVRQCSINLYDIQSQTLGDEAIFAMYESTMRQMAEQLMDDSKILKRFPPPRGKTRPRTAVENWHVVPFKHYVYSVHTEDTEMTSEGESREQKFSDDQDAMMGDQPTLRGYFLEFEEQESPPEVSTPEDQADSDSAMSGLTAPVFPQSFTNHPQDRDIPMHRSNFGQSSHAMNDFSAVAEEPRRRRAFDSTRQHDHQAQRAGYCSQLNNHSHVSSKYGWHGTRSLGTHASNTTNDFSRTHGNGMNNNGTMGNVTNQHGVSQHF